MDRQKIQEIVCTVIEPYDIQEVYLYGSHARGTNTQNSDIDLRFLCGDDMNFIQLAQIQAQLETLLGTSVDIATAPPDQMRPSFYSRVKSDEVKLYAAI